MSELARLQTWFLTVLATPTELDDGLENARRRLGLTLEDAIHQGPGAPSRTRMMVYANSYLLRLVQCLEAEYPVLRSVLGEEVFNLLAAAYVWENPSQSPTLYDLGATFPAFLKATQRGASELRLPVALANLERARAEVSRSRGVEHLKSAHVTGKWRAAPNLQLLLLQHPVSGFVQAVRAGQSPPLPAARPTWTAVSRRDFRIHTTDLMGWQYTLLSALVEEPLDLDGMTRQLPPEERTWLEPMVPAWLEDARASGQVVQQ